MSLTLPILSLENKESGTISLKKEIFGLEERKDILRSVINWQLSKKQAGTHKTKGISEIRGTSAKPFRQKGTGNARQGSRYATQHRGGATVFGPVPRSHSTKLPKKMRALGLKIALSVKAKSKSLIVMKDANLSKPKTSDLKKQLDALNLHSVLIVDGDKLNDNLVKASANLTKVQLLPTIGINVYDILRHKNLVLTESAVKRLEERLV